MRAPRSKAKPTAIAALLAAASLLAAGCGGGGDPLEAQLDESTAQTQILGFPALATKNTTRVAGDDALADAAAVAQAVYPSQAANERPAAVSLIDSDSWQSGVAASVLMSPPIGAPVLITNGGDIPDATAQAIETLQPRGLRKLRGLQGFVFGQAGAPDGLKTQRVEQTEPAEQAARIDELWQAVQGRPSPSVMVVSSEDPAYSMPAAAYAAKAGIPVLFTTRNELPAVTRSAIRRHRKPDIYLLGPETVVSRPVERNLRRLGETVRIAGGTAASNSVAFARFSNGTFGWGVNDPGHGLTFANVNRPLDAAASAALGASGTYAPLLLIESPDQLPNVVENFLLDIQPGYRFDPVRGVYNHAWLLGDESAISLGLQGRIDRLTEIVKIRAQAPSTGQGQRQGDQGSGRQEQRQESQPQDNPAQQDQSDQDQSTNGDDQLDQAP